MKTLNIRKNHKHRHKINQPEFLVSLAYQNIFAQKISDRFFFNFLIHPFTSTSFQFFIRSKFFKQDRVTVSKIQLKMNRTDIKDFHR